VGLFNIMQEGDVQIKGYPIRLKLDVVMAFTANPEDYTARGKIITPLKDRIGSEIMTHYPRRVEWGMDITWQEAWHQRPPGRAARPHRVPEFIAEVIERIAFEAREDKRVDKRSGVSQRLPISVLENTISNAERRSLVAGEDTVVPRVSDVYAAIPSITGKLELEYEGELQGGDLIARELIRRAAGRVLADRSDNVSFDDLVEWFDQGGALKVAGDERSDICLKGFGVVPGLIESARLLAEGDHPGEMVSACELILEGLAAQKRISRTEELGYTRARPEKREGGYGKGFNI
jgi:magnesium chelatase subunit I